jgi:UDP-N-acetylmuramate dehydrogenase
MQIHENVPLADYTSLHAGGVAKRLLTIEPGDTLVDMVAHAQDSGPVWVLGYGTNCLISDKGLPGTVILNRGGNIDQLSQTTFRAESGALWDDLVTDVLTAGLYGIEFTSGIPGGVGAAIKGNIAAYGHKVADTLQEVTMLDPKTGDIRIWKKSDLGLDYRSSILQKPEYEHLVILDATFELSPEPKGELEYESALRVAKDIDVQPDSLENRRTVILETRKRMSSLLVDTTTGPWTAGSFFKNPIVNEDQVESIIEHDESGVTREQLLRQNQIHGGSTVRVSAAHVLLAAGFSRGQTWGNVRLNPEHILKVENIGEATVQEIYDVVQEVITTVRRRLGIELEPEVRFLGEFN